MEIRKAKKEDLAGINSLLYQVLEVHHKGRPDLFYGGVKKYTDSEILEILQDPARPVFVAVEEGAVLGYAFCIFQQEKNSHVLTDVKTLYLDDLCVDETIRGKGVGKALFAYVKSFAKEEDCYNLTLNVWACNPSAMAFYEKCGLVPQKVYLETIL
ncbi:MAG: GNAT family N-acetyltransferase [Clostridia bacterium]|nr:GNAT family N-acetyltransferase [Clostridia bacterium]